MNTAFTLTSKLIAMYTKIYIFERQKMNKKNLRDQVELKQQKDHCWISVEDKNLTTTYNYLKRCIT